MKDETDLILEQRLKELPPKLREALRSNDLKKNLMDITKKHKLLFNQADVLETEVAFVLLGLESAADLTENLNRMGVPKENLDAILADVKTQIVDPIREELIAFTEKEYGGHDEEESEAPPPAKSAMKNTHKPKDTISADKYKEQSVPTPHQSETQDQPHMQENVSPQPPADQSAQREKTQNPFEKKFEQNVQSPPEETHFKEPDKNEEKKRPYSVDPYREPIE